MQFKLAVHLPPFPPPPLHPGGLTRGSSWKGRENKDRWLPGWAQSSKEGGEGKGTGADEQAQDKDKVGEPLVQGCCVHVWML